MPATVTVIANDTARPPHVPRRRIATVTAALAAAALLGVTAAASHAQTTYGPGLGGPLVDATFDETTGTTVGVFTSDIVLDQPGLFVDQVLSVTLTGLNHTLIGDLQISLTHFAPDDPIGRRVVLTFPPNDRNGNYAGDYTFVEDLLTPTVDEASAGLEDEGDGSVLPEGSYAISGESTDGTVLRTSFDFFQGVPVSGTWRLTITDYEAKDTGSLGRWSFSANTAGAVVPEPGTLALAPLGGLLALLATAGRRRRPHRRVCTN